jgi:hypothetical protein
MKYDRRFPEIVFWETLENAPLFLGFLLATRLLSNNWLLAFGSLLVGAACGAGLIHFSEAKKYSSRPTLKETLVNFAVFSLLPIPFVFYFSAQDIWWSNWGTDIVLGMAAGVGLAFGESWGWNDTATLKSHAVSMAISAVLFLLSMRLIRQIEAPALMVCVGLVFTLLISVLIVRLEYWPIKEPGPAQASHSAPDA